MSLALDMEALLEQTQAALRARRDALEATGQDVVHLRRDARQYLAQCRTDRRTSQREQRAALEGYVKDLRDHVSWLRTSTAEMLRGLARSRRDNAAELRSGLAQAAGDLAGAVGEHLAGLREARLSASEALRDELGGFAAELRQTVGWTLGERRQDRARARRIWTTQGAPAAAAPAAAPEPVAAAREPAAPPAAAEEEPPPAAADDLTEITGIGPAMQERLGKIGITTFAQLAEADPDHLREQLGDLGRLADVRSWIAQAARKG